MHVLLKTIHQKYFNMTKFKKVKRYLSIGRQARANEVVHVQTGSVFQSNIHRNADLHTIFTIVARNANVSKPRNTLAAVAALNIECFLAYMNFYQHG